MTSYTCRDPLPSPADVERDPLLAALAQARQRRDKADRDMRLLLAYAREITAPRPYRLADLAHAAGMSISGIRAAYTKDDTQRAVRLLGDAPQRHLQAAITTLLVTGQHAPARRASAATSPYECDFCLESGCRSPDTCPCACHGDPPQLGPDGEPTASPWDGPYPPFPARLADVDCDIDIRDPD